jgi:ferric-dicitrate binding protein FerR (iron transport regulator)
MNPAEFSPMDPRLEQALQEIRDAAPEAAVVEAAAARVWARLAVPEEQATQPGHSAIGEHLRTCADFQALIPEYRAGRLSEARAALLQDHLHECVACRKVYEGRVVSMATARPARRAAPVVRWAMAAAVVLAVGGAVWFVLQEYTGGTGRAVVQSVNGTLFALAADGTLHPLATGQDLPNGVEIRTAKDSGAMLRLGDGSLVEMRERSAVSTSAAAGDLTLRLDRGDVIVQAAHRR